MRRRLNPAQKGWITRRKRAAARSAASAKGWKTRRYRAAYYRGAATRKRNAPGLFKRKLRIIQKSHPGVTPEEAIRLAERLTLTKVASLEAERLGYSWVPRRKRYRNLKTGRLLTKGAFRVELARVTRKRRIDELQESYGFTRAGARRAERARERFQKRIDKLRKKIPGIGPAEVRRTLKAGDLDLFDLLIGELFFGSP